MRRVSAVPLVYVRSSVVYFTTGGVQTPSIGYDKHLQEQRECMCAFIHATSHIEFQTVQQAVCHVSNFELKQANFELKQATVCT